MKRQLTVNAITQYALHCWILVHASRYLILRSVAETATQMVR